MFFYCGNKSFMTLHSFLNQLWTLPDKPSNFFEKWSPGLVDSLSTDHGIQCAERKVIHALQFPGTHHETREQFTSSIPQPTENITGSTCSVRIRLD